MANITAFTIGDILTDGSKIKFDTEADIATFLEGLTYDNGQFPLVMATVTTENDNQEQNTFTGIVLMAGAMEYQDENEDYHTAYILAATSNGDTPVFLWSSAALEVGDTNVTQGWQNLDQDDCFTLDFSESSTVSIEISSITSEEGFNGVIAGLPSSSSEESGSGSEESGSGDEPSSGGDEPTSGDTEEDSEDNPWSSYSKTNWINNQTALNQYNLNKIEEGIYQTRENTIDLKVMVDDIVAALKSVNNGGLFDLAFNSTTKDLTITFGSSETPTVNTTKTVHINADNEERFKFIEDYITQYATSRTAYNNILDYEENSTTENSTVSNSGTPTTLENHTLFIIDVDDITNFTFATRTTLYINSESDETYPINKILFKDSNSNVLSYVDNPSSTVPIPDRVKLIYVSIMDSEINKIALQLQEEEVNDYSYFTLRNQWVSGNGINFDGTTINADLLFEAIVDQATIKHIKLKDNDGHYLYPTSDYLTLLNKPKINGVELGANTTLATLGIQPTMPEANAQHGGYMSQQAFSNLATLYNAYQNGTLGGGGNAEIDPEVLASLVTTSQLESAVSTLTQAVNGKQASNTKLTNISTNSNPGFLYSNGTTITPVADTMLRKPSSRTLTSKPTNDLDPTAILLGDDNASDNKPNLYALELKSFYFDLGTTFKDSETNALLTRISTGFYQGKVLHPLNPEVLTSQLCKITDFATITSILGLEGYEEAILESFDTDDYTLKSDRSDRPYNFSTLITSGVGITHGITEVTNALDISQERYDLTSLDTKYYKINTIESAFAIGYSVSYNTTTRKRSMYNTFIGGGTASFINATLSVILGEGIATIDDALVVAGKVALCKKRPSNTVYPEDNLDTSPAANSYFIPEDIMFNSFNIPTLNISAAIDTAISNGTKYTLNIDNAYSNPFNSIITPSTTLTDWANDYYENFGAFLYPEGTENDILRFYNSCIYDRPSIVKVIYLDPTNGVYNSALCKIKITSHSSVATIQKVQILDRLTPIMVSTATSTPLSSVTINSVTTTSDIVLSAPNGVLQGELTQVIKNLISNAYQKPLSSPSNYAIPVVDNSNNQMTLNLGNGFSVDTNTNTLSVSGGGGGAGGGAGYDTYMSSPYYGMVLCSGKDEINWEGVPVSLESGSMKAYVFQITGMTDMGVVFMLTTAPMFILKSNAEMMTMGDVTQISNVVEIDDGTQYKIKVVSSYIPDFIPVDTANEAVDTDKMYYYGENFESITGGSIDADGGWDPNETYYTDNGTPKSVIYVGRKLSGGSWEYVGFDFDGNVYTEVDTTTVTEPQSGVNYYIYNPSENSYSQFSGAAWDPDEKYYTRDTNTHELMMQTLYFPIS